MALNINKHYFTDDGTWGDARELVILDTRNFTHEEWQWIDTSPNGDRVRLAVTCFVRSFYRKRDESESGLPCLECVFVEEPSTDHGYVWLGCGSDPSDDTGNGCNWGNS